MEPGKGVGGVIKDWVQSQWEEAGLGRFGGRKGQDQRVGSWAWRIEVGLRAGGKNEFGSLSQVLGHWCLEDPAILRLPGSIVDSTGHPGQEMGEREAGLDLRQLDPGKILWGLQSQPSGTHLTPSAPGPEGLSGDS